MQYALGLDGDGRLTLDELQDELARWRRYDKKTVVDDYAGVPVFVNEFWTAKQRAAHSLHEISYRACFKPQLPRFFITRLTDPGRRGVLTRSWDGARRCSSRRSRGGRRWATTSTRCRASWSSPASIRRRWREVEARLRTLSLDGPAVHPEGFDVFFHERTLSRICRLRDYLRERRAAGSADAVDGWIQMVALNRLTGHSPGFFSVYTLPPNQAASIERQRKNNARRNQEPDYRDVADLILRKTRHLLRDVPPQGSHGAQPRVPPAACHGAVRLRRAARARWPITSPPFLNVVDYKGDNWMRCWFAGNRPRPRRHHADRPAWTPGRPSCARLSTTSPRSRRPVPSSRSRWGRFARARCGSSRSSPT